MRAAEARASIALLGAAAMVLVAAPPLARADGAFPDSQIILTPAARPREIILVTNFGLIQSEDGGATWLWSCEQMANLYGAYYQLGLPPRDRLYTLAGSQVTFSDDRGCVWDVARGLPPSAGGGVTDFWVDRTVTDRILAVETACCPGEQLAHALFESTDGGGTFPTTPLYRAAPGAMITGVESARSDPRTIYLTLLGAPMDGGSPPPMLVRTSDGGLTWQVADLSARLGPGMVRLVAVDPTDAGKVFLLWSGVDGQALAVTGDGGADARKILVPTGVLKAFLRLDRRRRDVRVSAGAPARTGPVGARGDGLRRHRQLRGGIRGRSIQRRGEHLDSAPRVRGRARHRPLREGRLSVDLRCRGAADLVVGGRLHGRRPGVVGRRRPGRAGRGVRYERRSRPAGRPWRGHGGRIGRAGRYGGKPGRRLFL
jgi:hypothetical protein